MTKYTNGRETINIIPDPIMVSEREWQEVQGGIRALRMDYEALAKETKEVKAKYEALMLKEKS